MLKRNFVRTVIGCSAFVVHSALAVTTPPTTITSVYSYTEYGTGDVLVLAASPTLDCQYGFWLNKSQPGFNATYAALLLAYTTKAQVLLYADATRKWGGTYNGTCHLTNITLA